MKIEVFNVTVKKKTQPLCENNFFIISFFSRTASGKREYKNKNTKELIHEFQISQSECVLVVLALAPTSSYYYCFKDILRGIILLDL